MPLPFDLEDVIGVSAASTLKRMAALVSCLWAGWFLVGMAAVIVNTGEWLWEGITLGDWSYWVFDESDFGWDLLFAPFIPFMSSWGVLYVPFVIGLVFYYVKADGPSLVVWGGATTVIGFFAMLCFEFWDSWEGGLVFGVWVFLVIGQFFFLKWWSAVRRARAERHLQLIAQENDRRRKEQKEHTGGAVADREFAVPHELERQGDR